MIFFRTLNNSHTQEGTLRKIKQAAVAAVLMLSCIAGERVDPRPRNSVPQLEKPS